MRTATGRRLTDTGERSIPPINAVPDLDDEATVGVLCRLLFTTARAKFLAVEIEDDWRTPYPEVRLVELVGGGRHVLVAYVEMPLGVAVAHALLRVWGPA